MSTFRDFYWSRTLAIGLIVSMTVSACDDSKPHQKSDQTLGKQSDSNQTSSGEQASKGETTPPDIAMAHAPKSEVGVFDANAAYSQAIDAPNDIMRDEIQTKKSIAWRSTVLSIGDFKRWSAYISDINSDGRIELRLSKTRVLKLWADVPKDALLFSTIRTLREGQPVYISGRIADTNVDVMKNSDDSLFPTCFEDGMGLVGCEIVLGEIEPL